MSRPPSAMVSCAGLYAIAVTATLMGPSFPLIVKEFNLPLELVGFLASAWSAGYLLSSIGGLLSDRYGEIRIITASFVIITVAASLISVASTYDLLLILFLLGGIGAAFGEAAMNPLISKLYPKRSGFALNFLHTFYCVGSFTGPILAVVIISWYGNWRLSYLTMTILFGPLILLSILAAHKSQSVGTGGKADEHVEAKQLYKGGSVLMMTGFFYIGTEMGTNAWLPTFLVLERNFPIWLAGLSLGFFWGAMALGRLILGSFTDRFRFRRMIMLSSTLSSILILVGITVQNQIWIVVSWSLCGFVLGPLLPTVFAWTNRQFPSRSGFATGVIYSVGFIGGVFSPWLLGTIADLSSLNLAMIYLFFSTSAVSVAMLPAKDPASVIQKADSNISQSSD